MLFSLRSILAVTFLTGLAPLSVFGAPLSQVEDGIERRALPEGHVVTIHDHENNIVAEHTLGASIGEGSTAIVHDVVGRPDLVAKVFHPGGIPRHQREEAEHLHQVGEFHGKADTDGHHVIFATKHTGHTLANTNAWQNANEVTKVNLRAQATLLTRQRNYHHAVFHGIVHTDTNFGNVHYHEHDGMLTNAHFVDWGNAKPAVVGPAPNHQLDARTAAIVHRSGSKAVHSVTR